MADLKYGRLFTEADVVMLLRSLEEQAVVHLALGADVEEVVRLGLEGLPTRFPSDEPLFLLRGKDKAALITLATYHSQSGQMLASVDHLHKVEAVLRAVVEWQREHPDRLKVAD